MAAPELVSIFRSVGDVCDILGKLVAPLQKLAQDLEDNPIGTTPRKSTSTRWTAADTSALNDALSKYGDDIEKIQEALPKKQLQDIQKKLDKLNTDKKRKQKDKREEGNSSDDQQNNKKSKQNTDNNNNEPKRIETKVSPKKTTEIKLSPKKSTLATRLEKTKSTATTPTTPTKSASSGPNSMGPPMKASPVTPSPDLGESSGESSDEFGD